MLRSSSSRSESPDLFAFMGNCDVREGKGAERFTKAVWRGELASRRNWLAKTMTIPEPIARAANVVTETSVKVPPSSVLTLTTVGKTSGNRIII